MKIKNGKKSPSKNFDIFGKTIPKNKGDKRYPAPTRSIKISGYNFSNAPESGNADGAARGTYPVFR